MRQKLRMRYYCDFCKKSGCSKHHIQRHENGCTLNPDRKCGMCKFVDMKDEQKPMAELIQALTDGGFPELRSVTNCCPSCMLAALRLAPEAGLKYKIHPKGEFPEIGVTDEYKEPICDGRFQFNAREAIKEVFAEKRAHEMEHGYGYY